MSVSRCLHNVSWNKERGFKSILGWKISKYGYTGTCLTKVKGSFWKIYSVEDLGKRNKRIKRGPIQCFKEGMEV